MHKIPLLPHIGPLSLPRQSCPLVAGAIVLHKLYGRVPLVLRSVRLNGGLQVRGALRAGSGCIRLA